MAENEGILGDEVNDKCGICKYPYTNNGNHRPMVTKCGHLFGYSCVLERFSNGNEMVCPKCQSLTLRKEVRQIIVHALVATDMAKRDKQARHALTQRMESGIDKFSDILKSVMKYKILKCPDPSAKDEGAPMERSTVGMLLLYIIFLAFFCYLFGFYYEIIFGIGKKIFILVVTAVNAYALTSRYLVSGYTACVAWHSFTLTPGFAGELRPLMAVEANTDDGLDWGRTCAICHDPYTHEGDHRLVVIRCGHLFGRSCILQVFQRLPANVIQIECPNCRQQTSPEDIRLVFARGIRVQDVAERDKQARIALIKKLESGIDKIPEVMKSVVNYVVPLIPLGFVIQNSPIHSQQFDNQAFIIKFIYCIISLISSQVISKLPQPQYEDMHFYWITSLCNVLNILVVGYCIPYCAVRHNQIKYKNG